MFAAGGVIDMHTHVVPSWLPAYTGLREDVPWPSILHTRSCCAQVMISGKVFREIEDSCWNVDRRYDDMVAMHTNMQLLSPMPELLSYWLDPIYAAVLARGINEEIAAMVATRPQEFRGLGMVQLQSVDAAIEELRHVMNVLKLDGVEIGTNVNGRPIGDQMFEPFFAAAEATGALIFVHPLRPAGRDQLVGPASLEQIVAFPCETALAIASLMTGGMLHRHPQLKLVFSHGGGAFAQVLPRLQHAWAMLPALQAATGAPPVELARRLYFDSLVYSPIALKFLVDLFGAGQIVVGTDYPFLIMDRTPMKTITALGLDGQTFDAICHGNAARLLQTT